MYIWRKGYKVVASTYSGAHTRLVAAINGYRVGAYCDTPDILTDGAYAFDILFLAYGDTYSTADVTTWSGGYMATGPKGLYPKVGMGKCTSASNVTVSFHTPTYSIPTDHYYKPYGRDNCRGLVMVLPQTDEDYASGTLMDQWCKNNTKTQVMVLADTVMAATSAAAGTELCVIAVGSPAVTAIQAQDSALVAYTSYTAWYDNRTTNPGFIDASGATGYDSYVKGFNAVQNAVDQV